MRIYCERFCIIPAQPWDAFIWVMQRTSSEKQYWLLTETKAIFVFSAYFCRARTKSRRVHLPLTGGIPGTLLSAIVLFFARIPDVPVWALITNYVCMLYALFFFICSRCPILHNILLCTISGIYSRFPKVRGHNGDILPNIDHLIAAEWAQ